MRITHENEGPACIVLQALSQRDIILVRIGEMHCPELYYTQALDKEL